MAKKPPQEFNPKIPLESPQQELFCTIFTSNTLPKFWGNGQNSYEFAYGYTDKIHTMDDQIDALHKLLREPNKKKRGGRTMKDIEREIEVKKKEIERIHRTCVSNASRLLTTDKVKQRNGYLLDTLSINLIVDRELTYLIQQRNDNNVKLGAIEHYNKREQRIREKVDIKHQFEPVKAVYID